MNIFKPARDLGLKAGDELIFKHAHGYNNQYRIVAPNGVTILDKDGEPCGKTALYAPYAVTKRATSVTGTLAELGVKVGDVVKVVATDKGKPVKNGVVWEMMCVSAKYPVGRKESYDRYHKGTALSTSALFTIVSRATQKPTIWKDMLREDQGNILLDQFNGKKLQMWATTFNNWVEVPPCHRIQTRNAYRIKPEPVKGSLKALNEYGVHTHTYEVSYVDGEPDMASVKPIS